MTFTATGGVVNARVRVAVRSTVALHGNGGGRLIRGRWLFDGAGVARVTFRFPRRNLICAGAKSNCEVRWRHGSRVDVSFTDGRSSRIGLRVVKVR